MNEEENTDIPLVEPKLRFGIVRIAHEAGSVFSEPVGKREGEKKCEGIMRRRYGEEEEYTSTPMFY
jgi:hypothetical protein